MRIYIICMLMLAGQAGAQTWQLQWSEEFNGSKLNTNVWNYETGNGEGGWGTGQMDYCTDRKENVDVKDGKLVITVRKEDMNGLDYTSGRINSRDKVTAKYGKIEARIKAPGGRGIGAAFWMLPQHEKFGWWPRSGEIDILETNGHQTNTNYGTVHFMQWETHQYNGHDVKIEGDVTREFHLYTIIWDEQSIRWYLDEKLFHEYSIREPVDGRSPFHEEFFFIISAGVGSDFSGKVIEDKLLPQTFEVDYLRVYKQVFKPTPVKAKTSEDGTSVELTFSHPVNPQAKPADFVVTDRGSAMPVQALACRYRDNFTLILTLEGKIRSESEVMVAYQGTSLESVEKQKADSFSGFPVVNTTSGAAPSLSRLTTSENIFTLELSFTRPIVLPDTLVPEKLKVHVNDRPVAIRKTGIKPGYPETIFIYLSEPLFDTSDVTVSYDGQVWKSVDGIPIRSFVNRKVINRLPLKYILPSRIEAEHYLKYHGIMSETCGDEGGGKNIGYIDTGDWMEYDVYVLESGTYKAAYRLAAAGSGAVAALLVDDKTLSVTDLPATYNWQAWKTADSGEFYLARGVHRLKLLAKTGGFNLNWIEIQSVGP